jgi:hypothetical protein
MRGSTISDASAPLLSPRTEGPPNVQETLEFPTLTGAGSCIDQIAETDLTAGNRSTNRIGPRIVALHWINDLKGGELMRIEPNSSVIPASSITKSG